MKTIKKEDMNKHNVEVVHQLFEAWNIGKIADIKKYYKKDCTRENIGSSNQQYSIQNLEQIIKQYFIAFPDIHFSVDDIIEKDASLVVCWRAKGHHKGKLMGIPATGKFINFTGVSILKIVNSQIENVWYMWDEAGMLRQMGLLTELRTVVEY